MLKEIASCIAKAKLPEILRRVEAGESFMITKHGKAIADLTPSKARTQQKTQRAIDSILKAKKVVISDSVLHYLKADGGK